MPSTEALETAPEIKLQMLEDGRAVTYGEMILVADEVDPVFRTLTEHGLTVTAVHNHMIFEESRLFFMHWWGVGEPQELATGLRVALDNMNIGRARRIDWTRQLFLALLRGSLMNRSCSYGSRGYNNAAFILALHHKRLIIPYPPKRGVYPEQCCLHAA